MVTVTIHGEQKQVQQGTTYEAIVSEYQKEYDGTIAVVSVNGKIRELFKKVSRDCTLEFFTLKDDVGHKTYVRTATMLFLKGINDVFGEEAARKSCVEFTIGRGIYVNTFGKVPVSEKSAERIMERMRQLSEAKTPFMKHSYPIDDAVALFKEKGMEDKVKLFTFQLTVNKTNGDNDPLPGAKFELRVEGSETVIAMNGEYADTMTSFVWKGLDEGKYTLTEVKTPDGYVTCDPIVFEIDADGNVTSDDPALSALIVKDKDGKEISSGDDATFAADISNCTVSTTVVNHAGTRLPTTGGTGVYMLYASGAVLILLAAAAAIVITKRKNV